MPQAYSFAAAAAATSDSVTGGESNVEDVSNDVNICDRNDGDDTSPSTAAEASRSESRPRHNRRRSANSNKGQLAVLAVRGYLASLVLIVPISLTLALYMEPILVNVAREDKLASKYAAQYYRVYVWSLPLYSVYVIMWKFLSAQKHGIVLPVVATSSASCVFVLPMALRYLSRWFGFRGTAASVLAHQAFQVVTLFLYLRWKRPHDPETWPVSGWFSFRSVLREAVRYGPFFYFVKLGLGGILACSGWLYWEVLALLVGSFGAVPLSVHTIPTQVLTCAYMIPRGLGIALAVRIGTILSVDSESAKSLARWSSATGVILFAALATALYLCRQPIFQLFTADSDVLNGVDAIWWKVCAHYFVTALFGSLTMGISVGMGVQWVQGLCLVASLWLFGLPVTYYFAVRENGGISAVWTWLTPPYVLVIAAMVIVFLTKDWAAVTEKIYRRESTVEVPVARIFGGFTNGNTTDAVSEAAACTFGDDQLRDCDSPGSMQQRLLPSHDGGALQVSV